MNSSLRTALLTSIVALMASSLSGKSGRDVAITQPLSIRLYNPAQAPAAVLRSATAEANRLFRAAGVRILWEQPSAEPAIDQGTNMTTAASRPPSERRYLVVRLMRPTPVRLLPGALGFALPSAHTGAHALIFYDRVEALSRDVNTAAYVILGHAMAHEIAHVLIGSSEHSTGGLMEARWTPATWRLASEGLLAFRRDEIERIQAGLQRFQATEPIPQRELILASSAAPQ